MAAVTVRADAYAPIHEQRLAVSPARVLQWGVFGILLGNVGRIPALDLGDRMAPILGNDVIAGVMLGVAAIAMLQARSLRLNDVAIAAALFASIGGLSTLYGIQRFGFSAIEIAGSLAYLARWIWYFAVINCARASDTEAIWLAVERMMLILVAFGIVQAIFLPNFAFIVYPDARESYDFDSQRHRLVSTILEPNVAAGMIIMVLLVQMARLATGARQAMWKPFLLFAGLVATLSRGGMLAFVVGGVALMLIRGVNRRLLKFGAAITGVFLLSLPYLIPYAIANNRLTVSDNSAMARVMVWQRALSTFADYPWFGIGFNTYGFVQERRGFQRMGGAAYSVEGGLLFVMVLTGIVGLAVYLTMLWLALRRARAAWRRPEATANERGLLIGTAVATIAVLVDSVFVNSLMTPWLMEPLWILWGLAFLIATDIKRRRFPPTA